MLIGEKIKNLRKNRRLTQEELGKLINTDGNTVSRWERDRLGVGSAYVAKLADALGTTTDYLLNGEPPAQNEPPKNNIPINNAPVENNLGLGYWGSVADNAQKVAARGDKEEIALITPLLRSALKSLTGEVLYEEKSARQIIGIQGGSNNENNMNVGT